MTLFSNRTIGWIFIGMLGIAVATSAEASGAGDGGIGRQLDRIDGELEGLTKATAEIDSDELRGLLSEVDASLEQARALLRRRQYRKASRVAATLPRQLDRVRAWVRLDALQDRRNALGNVLMELDRRRQLLEYEHSRWLLKVLGATLTHAWPSLEEGGP